MGKVFWIFASVCGAVYFGGNLYAGYAHSRATTAAFNDYRQMVKPDGGINKEGFKNAKPESDFGRQTMPYFVRIHERCQQFLKIADHATIGDALAWHKISTAEGRAASLKHIALGQDIWRSYTTDIWKIQREMLGKIDSVYARQLQPQIASMTAEEGKYLRMRLALFDEAREIVELVGKSKLTEYEGTMAFDSEDHAHYEAYRKMVADFEKHATDFDKQWAAYKDRVKEDDAEQFDRLRYQAYGTHP